MKKKFNKKKDLRYLALVRHGESEWNALGKWTGWEDSTLTEKGKEEARAVAKALTAHDFHVAFTSDLSRAHQTLELIKEEMKLQHIPTSKHPALKERHYGVYTGKVKWEIQVEVGEEQFKHIRRGWDAAIPEGETLKDVFNRVVPHYTEHIHPHLAKGNNVLLVAHGNTLRSLIKHLEEIPDDAIADVEVATGEVIIYGFDHTGKLVHKEKLVTNEKKGKQ